MAAVACICGPGHHAGAAEEVLVERKMTKEQRALFTITAFEKDVSEFPTIEMLKQRYAHVIASSDVVKVVLVYDKATRKPRKIKMVVRAVKPVETLYERKLREEDLNRYTLTKSGGLGTGLSLDEIRKRFGTAYWDRQWGVQKVELVFRGTLEGRPDKDPHLLVTRLLGGPVKTEAEKIAEAEWIQSAKKRFAVGKDAAGFKHQKTEAEHVSHLDDEYTRPMPVGGVDEVFWNPKAGTMWGLNLCTVRVGIIEWPGKRVPRHEFFRLVMEHWAVASESKIDFRPKRMAHGVVLVGHHRRSMPDKGSSHTTYFTWMSGNVAVYVEAMNASPAGLRVKARNVSPAGLLDLYGARFPSTLPREIDLDKITWYRAEIDSILSRLERLAASTKLTRGDWFTNDLNRLLQCVHVPDLAHNMALRASPVRKKVLYKQVSDWWKKNGQDTVWDRKQGKLIARDR